jgi:hypothetical protein
MESKIRKLSDIWNIIDNQRLQYNMKKNEWKRSYIGVTTALNHIGLEVITTKEEFEKIEIPTKNNNKKYLFRKIIVSRNGIISSPTKITHLISGQSGLLTQDEKNIIYDKQSKALSIIHPKGIAKANNQEAETIDALNIKLNMSSTFDIIHLDEFRLTDICFKEYNSNDTPRPTKNSTLIILSLLDKNKILLYEEFRKAVLQLYTYFNSMRKTALALKISIASISRWTKKLEPKQYVRKNIKTSSSMKFLNFFLDEILLKIFSNIRFLNIFF